MTEFAGFESFQPSEGQVSGSEILSEQAKQRFAAAAAQLKQIAKEEKRARKRDDRVARTIIQFLNDQRHTHLFLLISRLVARDCPSIFILAILSLIHEASKETAEEYIGEYRMHIARRDDESVDITKNSRHLSAAMNNELLQWIERLQIVLSIDSMKILEKLLVDAHNIDGTVLQLTTFVLIEFFEKNNRNITFTQLQPMTISILQTILEPYMQEIAQHFRVDVPSADNQND